jgi:uncharacterized oligopeptide transporter (OPT) family protein
MTSQPSPPDPRLSSVKDALSLRAIACAVLLGSAVCSANMCLGLQAGIVNAMPMPTALLGFAVFRGIQHRLSKPLSPAETTTIEIIAGALGLAPFTSGYTGPIPALEFLTLSPVEDEAIKFSVGQLLLWCIAISALGTVVAAPFRQLFIFRERLRYPSAAATGTLIGVLFGKETIVVRAQQSENQVSASHHLEAETEQNPPEVASRSEVDRCADPDVSDHLDSIVSTGDIGYAVNLLLALMAGSSLFVSRSYHLQTLCKPGQLM